MLLLSTELTRHEAKFSKPKLEVSGDQASLSELHMLSGSRRVLRPFEAPPERSSASTAGPAAARRRRSLRTRSCGRCTDTAPRSPPARRQLRRKWPWRLLQLASVQRRNCTRDKIRHGATSITEQGFIIRFGNYPRNRDENP